MRIFEDWTQRQAAGCVTWSKRKVTICGLPVEVEQLVKVILPTLSCKANLRT